ncbi:hypothetical protein PR002_g26400, partial [Phytophthora rubi]
MAQRAASVQPYPDIPSKKTLKTGDGACRTGTTTYTVGNANPTTAPAINPEYSSVTAEAPVTTTEDSSVTADGPHEAQQRRHGGLPEYTGPLPRRQREITHVMRVEVAQDQEGAAVGTPAEKNPVQSMAAVMAEMHRADAVNAKVLQARAANDAMEEKKTEEAARWAARATKRRERAHRRRLARKEREQRHGDGVLVTVGDVMRVTSERDGQSKAAPEEGDLRPGPTPERQVKMPEPSPELRDAMVWSVRARDALREVEARRGALTEGFAKLAVVEAERLELLAAGNVVGENETRDGVARQLIAAAAGLRAIAADDWTDGEETPLHVSRARRRFEKKVQKARAKARRQQQRHDTLPQYETETFTAMDELRRQGRDRARKFTREEAEAVELVLPYATEALRKKQRQKQRRDYDYHSGSYYQEPVLEEREGHAQPVRVGKLRAARASTIDLLPTATMLVRNERKPVKIDTGAQYSVAGQGWSRYGTKLDTVAPVDYMEGFSGVAVKVLGAWRFDFLTQYQQHMQVDALLVASDTPDFLVGEDWMYAQGVKIDFLASEMKWYADDEKIVVPFTGIGTSTARGTGAAKVRLLKQAKVVTQTMHHVHLAVEAPDGSVG